MKLEEIEKRIDLAMLANGGEAIRKDWCQCDPSVGHTPCEYCAIRNGLIAAKEFLSKYLPCPNHRDKVESGRCYLCEVEKLRAFIERNEMV